VSLNFRSMSERQTALLRRCEREAKDKMRLSMDNEQLQWLLNQGSANDSTLSDDVSDYVTECLATRSRGSTCRVTPSHVTKMSRSCESSTDLSRVTNSQKSVPLATTVTPSATTATTAT